MFGIPSEFFMTPAQRKRAADDERAAFERVAAKAVPWDPAMKAPRHDTCFIGETYRFDFNGPLTPPKIATYPFDTTDGCYIDRGDWRYRLSTLARGTYLDCPYRADAERHPRVSFDSDVVFPVLHKNTPVSANATRFEWRVWMSLTPAEIFSQRSGIRFCRDTVVIGGLGLGYFLHEAAKRSQVKKIIVVEKDADLLNWYGHDLCKKYGAEVVCDDVWNVVPKMPKTTRFALDIWPGFYDARYDHKLRSARAAGHQIWAWGSPRG